MAAGWYVIRTMSRCERRAAKALEREGVEHYFPRVRITRPPGGGAIRPLFPGYLFVRHDQESPDWPEVQTLPGIIGWLRCDNIVPTVPDVVIEEIDRRVREINGTGGVWDRFEAGDTVLVTSGKLESLAEVLEGPKSPEARVRVLLDFMGRQVPANVPWHDLKPAGEDVVRESMRRRRRTRGKGRWVRCFGPSRVPAVPLGASS